VSRSRSIIAVAVAATLTITACASAPNALPAAGDAAAACEALAAWENGPATDTLSNDPAAARIAHLGAGTQFGTDFNTWMNDMNQANADAALADGNQVSADCAAAGVPGALVAAATTAPAAAAQQTDPNGQQCAALDSQGYCPGDDPSPSPPAPTMTKQTDRIVFRVAGNGEPSIQYGTDSSTNNPSDGAGPLGDGNYLPWTASMPYNPSALYYTVSGQLEGSGSIHDSVTEVVTTWCSWSKPKTESFLLASGNASGGYGIATAEYASGNTCNATQAESDAGC
jgi:hypothetical protein